MVPSDESEKRTEKCAAKAASSKKSGTSPEAANRCSVEGPGWQMHEAPSSSLPPMDFTTFCLSLASSAMIHLGLSPSPETSKTEQNLPLAQQTIDILALLEDKTVNNLSPDEVRLLGTLLYDLRLRFCDANRQP